MASEGEDTRASLLLRDRIRQVIARVLEVPASRLDPSAVLSEVAALDSLKLVEVAAALDEEFETRLPSDELGAIRTVDDVARLVARWT